MFTLEERILKFTIIAIIASFHEAVHVQLPHEGVVITVFEVFGQYIRFKLLHVMNHKAQTIRLPADIRSVRWFTKDLPQLFQKGSAGSQLSITLGHPSILLFAFRCDHPH